MPIAEFSIFAGILTAALSEHHLLGFDPESRPHCQAAKDKGDREAITDGRGRGGLHNALGKAGDVESRPCRAPHLDQHPR